MLAVGWGVFQPLPALDWVQGMVLTEGALQGSVPMCSPTSATPRHMEKCMPSPVPLSCSWPTPSACPRRTGCTWHPKARYWAGHGAARGNNHQSVQSQHEEHQEEEDGPERGAGQQGEGFRVSHERQPRACRERCREV